MHINWTLRINGQISCKPQTTENQPRWNSNLNSPITMKEIEFAIKTFM